MKFLNCFRFFGIIFALLDPDPHSTILTATFLFHHPFYVRRGSVGSASACSKAGPRSILGSAPQGGFSHWSCHQTFNIHKPNISVLQAEEGTGRILIARVMHGGAADRSGLIAVGDEVIEVSMYIPFSRVGDPWHFDADPDPQSRSLPLANKSGSGIQIRTQLRIRLLSSMTLRMC